MSELEAAQRHLADALQRIQTAVERRSSGTALQHADLAGLQRDDLAQHVSTLRGECDRLSAALSEARRDNDNLRRVSTQVARRLDSSIAEIDRLLEG
jgi:chromosome segregation ATPase